MFLRKITSLGISLSLGALFAASLSACHFGDPLEVLHASPTSDLDAPPQWIEVRFDKPIIDPDATEPKAEGVSVRLSPPVLGEVAFPTPSSLTYTFNGPVLPAQTYTVTVESGLRSFDGKSVLKKDYTFEFTTERNGPTGIYRVEPAQEDEGFPSSGERRVTNLALDSSLLVTLRFPESVEKLTKIVQVNGKPMKGEGAAAPMAFNLAFPAEDNADRFIVSPKGEWKKHTNLEVVLGSELSVAGIPAGKQMMQEAKTLDAATYGPIEVVRGPECEMCRPPATLVFEFSTPVNCDDVLPLVRVRPEPEQLRCAGQPAPTFVRIEPVPGLSPHTKYKINLRPGLTDAFGQKLEERIRFDMETGDANPRFAHQLMFNVLEREQGPFHEEKVYRTSSLEVQGARMPFNDAWKIIAKEGLASQVAWRSLPWWLSDSYGYGYQDYGCHWNESTGEEECGSSKRRLPGAIDSPDLVIPSSKTQKIETDAEDWSVVKIPLEPYLEGKGGIVVIKSTPKDNKGNLLSSPVVRLLNVTNIGLSAKYSPTQLLVVAAKLSDGKPIAGAKVSAFNVTVGEAADLGDPLATATTDETGAAMFGAAQLTRAGEDPNLQNHGLFITASLGDGDDEAFIWSSFQSGGRKASSSGPGLVGKVYTERGVYRPGEKVFYRAVLRKQVAGGLSTPTGEVQVTGKRGYSYYDDNEDDSIYSQKQELSEYGTVEGSFEVPSDARIGDYSLVVKLEEQGLSGQFKVAEFRRAEMKVTVNTNDTEYVRGQKMQVRINADYLFGAPASGLDARWSLRRSWGHFDSKRFPGARFSDSDYHSWYDEHSSYTEFVDEKNIKLDSKGSHTFTRQLKAAGSKGKMENLVVSATVDDASGQSVSARRTVRVHPASFHTGIIPRGYLKDKDKMFTFEAVAVTPDDEPFAGAKLTLSTYQVYYYSTKRKGPGGRIYWDYKREVIEEDNICKGTTDANGKIECQYTPKKGGSLRIRVRGKDKKGRKVQASSWFWVTGDSDYYGGRSDSSNQVGIMAEAPEVEVGETARIAITSPFKNALALITVEREDILWRKVMEIGSNGVIDLPVSANWAPNVYVSATITRGRVTPEGEMKPDPERDKPAYALGYLNLKVKPTRQVIGVEVSTAQPKYEPGQTVVAQVVTKNHAGAPVSAQVNLFAVDEGVLMLTGYKTPNLIPSMFTERPYSVVALETRMHVLGRRHFITPVVKGEEDGSGGGEGEAQGEELRQDFNPVATWIGSLVTNAEGMATHSFELPDTLTTYRLMAVAVGRTDKFGSGETELKVQKTLMMRQSMPRFARPADTMLAGVVVNQLSGKAGEVTVELEKIDESLFKVRGPKIIKQTVGAKETVAFRFDLEAADADGESEIIFAAKMGKFGDRVQLKLPVKRLIPRESKSVAGVLEPGKVSHTLAVPNGARAIDLDVSLSGLPVASLEEKVRQLVGYPYGCLEQRTSKIMPLIAIRELAEELEFASVPTDKIEGWVQEWVKLVPKYRCSDDGFDYYPGCRSGSNTYLTAFALDGLLTARQFGFKVPDSTIDPAAKYLQKKLASMDPNGKSWDGNASGLAGALRVLAQLQKSEPSAETRMYEARSSLPLFAKTDLIRAIFARTGKRNEMVDALLADIGQKAQKGGGVIKFAATDPNQYWWAWDSDLRSTALVLRTLLEVEPTDARVPLIVRGLIDLDDQESYYTTQGVTQTLLALAEAAKRLKDMNQSPVATISLGDEAIVDGKKIGTKVEQTTVTAAQLGKSPFELSLNNSGDGPLYFGAFLHYAYPATARLPAKDDGFKVERSYTDRDGKPIGKMVRVGDYVMVNLKVWVHEKARMVVVDDPLPAGLEPVDTTLATSDTEMAEVMEGAGGDWSWWRSRYQEMRDDRTEWHFRQLWPTSGSYPLKLSYLTRATTTGEYYAPGTTVERLYQPQVRGRGPGQELTVKPKP